MVRPTLRLYTSDLSRWPLGTVPGYSAAHRLWLCLLLLVAFPILFPPLYPSVKSQGEGLGIFRQGSLQLD